MGVVLSFVIFVTFLIFLYSVIGPNINISDKDSFLDYLRIELLGRFSTNLTRVTVSTESTASCIKLNGFNELAGVGSNLIVKDSNDDIVDSGIYLDQDLIIEENEDFFRVYSSETFDELEEKTISCTELEYETGYSITLIRKEQYVFKKRVEEFVNEYGTEEGYENLKTELKIPRGTEFGLSFTESNGSVIETIEREISGDVFAREIPIQYVDDEANILLGVMNIKVW